MMKIPQWVATAGLLTTCLALCQTAKADSDVVINPANGHRYQRIETPMKWGAASLSCIERGAHLATITSSTENSFVASVASGAWVWLGGFRLYPDPWEWVTGEPMVFEPSLDGYYGNHLLLQPDARWQGDDPDWEEYSVCEWDDPDRRQISVLPDLNGNGATEFATLGTNPVAGKYEVVIRDSSTNREINTLTFGNSIVKPPAGMAVISDTNANGRPDIAVLYESPTTSKIVVVIKDAKGSKALRSFVFLNSEFVPRAITASPDEDGNGYDELTVLAQNRATGAYRIQTKDSKTGAKLRTKTVP